MSDLSSLEKGLRLLRELASSERGLTPAELARAAGLNRSTVYRLAENLSREGWVQRFEANEETTRLDIGPAMQGLAILVSNKYEVNTQIQPIISGLARSLSETVHIGALDHNQVVHIAVAMPDTGLSVAARLGSRAPAHSAALGKALLATMTDEEVRRLYGVEQLPVQTPTTISTVSVLIAELVKTRARGYALDNQESRTGVFCIAVPVFGPGANPLFAVSVTTVPTQDKERRAHLITAVQAAASFATTSFGGNDRDWRTRADEKHQRDGDRYRNRIAVPR